MVEVGIVPYDFILMPESSCPWTPSNDSAQIKRTRVWHPFLVQAYKFQKFIGLVCTSSPPRYGRQDRIELPINDSKKIRWLDGFQPTDRGFATLPTCQVAFGYLLFEGEARPQKIGTVLCQEMRISIAKESEPKEGQP